MELYKQKSEDGCRVTCKGKTWIEPRYLETVLLKLTIGLDGIPSNTITLSVGEKEIMFSLTGFKRRMEHVVHYRLRNLPTKRSHIWLAHIWWSLSGKPLHNRELLRPSTWKAPIDYSPIYHR